MGRGISISVSDKILLGIAEAARSVGARRVVLFGSRARGDASPVSDIDLAVDGADAADFLDALDEHADTLLRFDAVQLDSQLPPELAREIERDGVIVYNHKGDENLKKLENFERCLAILRSADAESARRDEIYRAGVIAQFSLTFEMAWKSLQAALRAHAVAGAEINSNSNLRFLVPLHAGERSLVERGGAAAPIQKLDETGSPREILKLGFAAGFVGDEDIWLAMIRDRNSAAHIYGREEEIGAMTDRILRDCIPAFERLASALAEKLRAASD